MTESEQQKELMQLRSTEAHLVQLMADAGDEERELLMAKYRRTQARRMTLEMQKS